MTLRLLILGAVLFAAGCGDTAPTTAPAAPGAKLPPEAEFDPVTATEKYQKKNKPKP